MVKKMPKVQGSADEALQLVANTATVSTDASVYGSGAPFTVSVAQHTHQVIESQEEPKQPKAS